MKLSTLMAKVGGIVLIVTSVGISFVYWKLSKFDDPPVAPVVGVPEGALSHLPGAPYLGEHPRNMKRPRERSEFPIEIGSLGPVDPLFSGPLTYPFYCGRNLITGGQPQVDNLLREGVPVFEQVSGKPVYDHVVGYSRDCSHPTQAKYFYRSSSDGKFHPFEYAASDIDKIFVDGKTVDFVVRLETGTINRFFYAIAVLKGENETVARPSGTNWNKRLIYQFRGGVGIGRRQGDIRPEDILDRRSEELSRGYGIVYSTANNTSVHYNIWLAEDTARRLKRQFSSLYGEPLYTVGLGGSGGAIQQYLLAQNAPGVLDGAIPLYSYPDMVTQIIYVFDCEPLEYYFDVIDGESSQWKYATNRSVIQGLGGNDKVRPRFDRLVKFASIFDSRYRDMAHGATECAQNWRGLVPRVNNPRYVDFSRDYDIDISKKSHWTHWEDLRQFYGVNDSGFANSAWDNEGVQYGLKSLIDGEISISTFLAINAAIGGWKSQENQKDEKFWFLNGGVFPLEFSIWSDHNMNLGALAAPARRSRASLKAIEGIYRSGHVFLGDVEVPIVDLRHYLDEVPDMHHSSASFSARERIRNSRGHADNQLIWVSDRNYSPIAEALDVIDRWILNIKKRPENGVVKNRPRDASDKCFDENGIGIAAGDNVWGSASGNQHTGECRKKYPVYSNSRQVAGAPISDSIFKCKLQPIDTALNEGLYGARSTDVIKHMDDMKRVFPGGVCDYTQPDLGRPTEALVDQHVPVTIAGGLILPDYRHSRENVAEYVNNEDR